MLLHCSFFVGVVYSLLSLLFACFRLTALDQVCMIGCMCFLVGQGSTKSLRQRVTVLDLGIEYGSLGLSCMIWYAKTTLLVRLVLCTGLRQFERPVVVVTEYLD